MDENSISNTPSKANTYLLIGCIILFCILATIIVSAFHVVSFSLNSPNAILNNLKKSNNTISSAAVTYIGKITQISGNNVTIMNNGQSITLAVNPYVYFGHLPVSNRLRLIDISKDLSIGEYIQVESKTTKTGNIVTYVFQLTPDYFNALNSSTQ